MGLMTKKAMRKRLVWLGWTATVLFLLGVSLWLFIFHSTAGAALVVRRFLEWYNGQISGEVSVGEFDGTIANGLTLMQITGKSADNREVMRIGELHVSITPLYLLKNEVNVGTFRLRYMTVPAPSPGTSSGLRDLLIPEKTETHKETAGWLPTLPIHLRAPSILLENIQVDLNANSGTPLTIKLETVSGALDWRRDLTVNLRRLRGSGVVQQQHFRFRLDDAQRIELKNYQINTALEISADWGKLRVQLASALNDGFDSELQVALTVPSLQTLFDKSGWATSLDGNIKGDGTISFNLDDNGNPVVQSSFSCPDCVLHPFGKMDVKLDVGMKDSAVDARVSLSGHNAQMSASYTGDTQGRGKMQVAANGGMPSNIAGHFGITGEIEKIDVRGICHFDLDSTCNASIQMLGGAIDNMTVAAAEVELNAAVGKNSAAFDGTAVLDEFRVGKNTFRQARVTGTYDGSDAQLSLHVIQNKSAVGTADLRVSTGSETTIDVQRIDSSLSGLRIRSGSPFRALVANGVVRTLSPVVLQINDGAAVIEQFEKDQEKINGKVAVKNLQLEPFAYYLDEPVAGNVTGTASVSGTMSNPSLQLSLNAADIIIHNVALSTLSVEGELKNRRLALSANGAGENDLAIDAAGEFPVHIDLKHGDVRFIKKRRVRADWKFRHIDQSLVSHFTSLPEGLTFSANGSGSLHLSKSQTRINGNLEGNVSHPFIGGMDFQIDHDIRSDAQTLHLQTVDRGGEPVSIDVTSTLNMGDILRQQVNEGEVSLTASIGDAKLGLQAGLEDAIVNLHASANRFSLSTVGAYLDMPELNGHLNGNIKFQFDPKKLNVRFVTDAPWQLDLIVEHLSPEQLPGWRIDMGPLKFDATLTGTLRCDGRDVSATGNLDGWLGDGVIIRFPARLNFDVRQNAQSLHAEWLMPNGVPASLKLTGTFDIATLDFAAITQTHFAPHQWQLKLNWGDATATLQADIESMQTATVAYQIRDFSPILLKPMVLLEGLDGKLSANGELTLTDNVLSGTADIVATDVVIKDWSMQRIRLTGQYENARLKLNMDGAHPYGRDIHLMADVPLRVNVPTMDIAWQSNGEHRIAWRIPPVNLYPLRHVLGISDVFDISLGTEGQLTGNVHSYRLTSTIGGSAGAAGMMSVSLDGGLNASNATQRLKVIAVQRGLEKSVVTLETKASLARLISGNQIWSDIPMTARLEMNAIELQLLELLSIPLLSRLGGTVVGNARATGTLGKPSITGRLKLQDGQFSIAGLANRIHGVNGELRLNRNSVSIPWLRFKSARGGGSFVANGHFDQEGLSGSGRLKMSRFPVALAGLPRFIVDAHSTAEFRIDRSRFDLDVTLMDTTFTKPAEERNAAKFVPSNANVIVRNSYDEEETAEDLFDYRIHLKSDSPIAVKGRDLNTAWNADIVMHRKEGVAQAGGRIDAVGGTFNLFQNSFAIERGELTIAETPGKGAFIQLESVGNISSYTVYLNVSGNLLHPVLNLSSSPALTEEQILTLLVSGSTEEDAETSTGAVTNLLATQYPGVHNLLYNRFGISQLRVETTEQGSTALKAGKRVSERSTVYTVVNANPAANENEFELQIEVSLTDKTSVGTAVGQNSSSIGIYRRFVIPNKKKRPITLPRRLRAP